MFKVSSQLNHDDVPLFTQKRVVNMFCVMSCKLYIDYFQNHTLFVLVGLIVYETLLNYIYELLDVMLCD